MSRSINHQIIQKLLAISAAFLLGGAASTAASGCERNLSANLTDQADAFMAENRSAQAYGVMHTASQNGSGGAYRYLANMYEQGRGVEGSPFMARHMNWMGSQYHDPESMYRAAKDFYARGHRKDGDYLATKAKECGHPGAIILLMERSILEGRDADARKLLEMGIDAGIPEAKFALAEQYDKGGLGLPKDPQRAFYWYTESAKHGEAKAMAAIAYYFFRGQHGVQDEFAAVHWYHQAAKASHVESMTAYGWMLMSGKGAQANPDEAFGYLKRASKMGDKQADVFLAQLVKAKHK